jgi:uncharacterized protein (DUF1697 family)
MGATQYVAFLRAVNVGGRIVKMAELKKVFETAGLSNVSTFIASGNVIFTSPKPTATLHTLIETALEKSLGYVVTTMLRRTEEVAAVAEFPAFTPRALAGASLYVGFMRAGVTAVNVKKTLALNTSVDELRVHETEVYWLARKNISESTITGAAIEKALQTPVTFRNINTVRRLAAKYHAR